MRGRDERGDRGDLERRAERREDPHSSVGRGGSADDGVLTSLPRALVEQSLSHTRLILPFDLAVQAIEHMRAEGRRLENWEGWVKLRDGSRARSLTHAGSFALPREPQRAADTARDGMQRAQARWDRDPEYPGAELYFALSFGETT